jgi:hypothetical protein
MADLDIAVQEYAESRRALTVIQEDEVLQNCTSLIQSLMTLCLVAADNLLDAIIPDGCEIEYE